MMPLRATASVEDWLKLLEQLSGDRCDLDVLLRDEWRHKIVARDDGSLRSTATRTITLGGAAYAAIKGQAGSDDGPSLGALSLATLHTSLVGFGDGTKTVIALVDAIGLASASYAKTLPTVVDHAELSTMTCGMAAAKIADALRDKGAYQHPDALFGRGLFDTVLVLADGDLLQSGLPAAPLVAVVQDDESARCLRWTIVYATELFDDLVIRGILDVVREVFVQCATRPERLVRDVELVSEDQKRQLAAWNRTDGDFAEDKRLNELFEDCAQREPDREAVVFRNESISYRELNERSNQLAHWLLSPAVGVDRQDRIGVYLDKSHLGVIATFAIWKAGAAYVPIDSTYAADRVRLTVADTTPIAIITNRRHSAGLRQILDAEGSKAVTVEIESVLGADGVTKRMSRQNPSLELHSEDLAYVTYTSGTAGIPKGVPKDHRSAVNSITDLSQRYDMQQPGQERVALFASYAFEPHLRQTLIALINGQTLVVIPEDIRLDPDLFPAYLARHHITYLNATGSVLQHFDLHRCPDLKKVLVVGEELTSAGLRQLREHFSGLIINEYAFTESAFVTAVKEFTPGTVERTDRSIGRPLRNVTWYVLSPERKQLPIGAIGELYIGGCGVARGYVNRDDLTRKAFFPNPFQSERDKHRGHNACIYRTGDLGRVLPNGEVEYLGRADFQLKINGVRVEPGEIEARATEYPGVQKCVVVAREVSDRPGDRRLVGYYVADPKVEISETDLQAFLEKRLIQIMVPARMIRLDRIPLNVNGKVDRRALPEPELNVRASLPDDHADDLEDVLAALRHIWSTVLGVPEARIKESDDFFRLGGHSISCILIIARIRQHLHRTIGVEEVFRIRTLRSLAEHLARKRQIEPTGDRYPTAEKPGAGSLIANGLQQGLLYHAMTSQEGDDAYVVQSVYRYRSGIRPDLMEQAWRHARRKYPSLRLRFELDEEPIQIVEPADGPLDWRYVDLSEHASADEQEAAIERLREEDRAEPYRPAEGRLFRVYLIKQSNDRFTLVFSCHHLIIDGWSLPVLHDEVHRIYVELTQGRTIDAGEDRAYLTAQRYWQAHRHDHIAYWTNQIEKIEERGDYNGLLNARSRYRVSLGTYDRVRERRSKKLRLGADLTSALAEACAANEVTLHSVLQFVWHKALHAIGGGRSTVVGTIVSGRHMPIDSIDSSVGLFINTLPLVVEHDSQNKQCVAAAIADIQSAVNTMNAKSIVELGRLHSGMMKRQLFDTLLVLENYPQLLDDAEERRLREQLRFERFFDADRVDHPMAVVGREEDDELTVTLWFASEIFEDTALDTLLEVTRTLFVQVAHDMSRPVSDLDFLSPPMVEQLEAWNHTEVDFPDDKTLSAIFDEVAANWSDKTAVVYNDKTLTYRELNEQANQLANRLRTLTRLRSDDLIALVMNKSELMITAIIAVWKTGAAYVPIDPEYPDERIAFMLEDTDARLVLANREHTARLRTLAAGANRPVLAVEDLELEGEPCDNVVTETKSTDLAYAIYTSGTTGRPKAVLVEHRGVVNLQTSLARLFRLDKRHGDEAVMSFSNYVFDHFVEVITDALLNGQKLVVLDDRMRTDERRLCRYMNDNHVTYLSGTPSVLSLYDFSAVRSLRRIDAIGEDFTEPVFAKIRRTFPHGVIVNGYGPTEISITSHKRPYETDDGRLDKSIGFPVANTTCYVLNSAMKRVPVNGVGELYIGGVGVARGYLNKPELTAERFVDNPFQTSEEKRQGRNGRLYKTGDLARWLPNGEIEYLGRTDLQVKIRGQRVELAEIESVLASYPGVARALVIAREHRTTSTSVAPQKYLVGFYIGERNLDEADVKRWMRRKLSDALVPARITRIADIPVTPSGKLDVKRLPETEFVSERSVPFAAPSTDLEIRLCAMWSLVLGTRPELIGLNDDFFALGGDSIRAMTLAQAVTSTFDCDVSVPNIFQDTTIAAQARRVQQAMTAGRSAEVESSTDMPTVRAEWPPVSFAQERLLFIDEFEGGTAAYNIPFCLRLTGVSQEALIEAVRALVRRHAALRTLVRASEDGLYRQYVLSEREGLALFEVETLVAGSKAELDLILTAQAQHVFCLGEKLPFRATLVSVPALPDEVFLSLVFHHTCFDGWSWDIFRRELAALLGGASEAQLPPVRARYTDFAVWQRRYISGFRLLELTQYWTHALAELEPVRLLLDLPRPPRFDYRGRELPFDLDAETTEYLRALARSVGVSLYSLLLAAWCLMLRVYTGQQDLVVGTPSANRGRPEFSDVVGLLANLVAVRVRVNKTATVTDYIREVGAAVVAAQVHADLPFERLIKELDVETDLGRHPVVQINFTLLTWTGPNENSGTVSEYTPDDPESTSVKFDLSAMLREVPEGLGGNVTYAASLFKDATVNGFVATFKQILTQFAHVFHTADSIRVCDLAWANDLDVSVGQLSTVAPPTDCSALPNSLHALFERAAGERPDDIAVACGDTHLTFRELNKRASQLARHLRATTPLRSRDLIALVLDKNELLIVAILAVWKAGAGYVPIDPSHPGDRIAFMLRDTKARLVLTNQLHRERLLGIVADAVPPVLDLEMLAFDDQSPENPVIRSTDADLAYAIYTSGTTGCPKAVLVTHRNGVSFHESLRGRYFEPDGKSRESVLFLSNYVFDFSIEQLVLSVLSGNKLVIPPRMPGPDLYDYGEHEELTYLSGTPTQIQQLDLSRLTHLRGVLAAGEPFLPHHLDHIRRQYSGPVYNAYGTTETTVYNTVRRFEPGEAYRNDLGEPLSNTRLYVLDDALKPLPPGAPGELYMAGECVSDGYLNKPDLTLERFAPNHLQTDAERLDGRFAVLYKTGDLVRRGRDGELHFLGRNDEQLKIRGLRIEPGEVEAAIRSCPGVRECAVVGRRDEGSPGEKRLIAYYVPESGTSINNEQVLGALRAKLAPYMVPSLLMRLDGPLPLTSNGKLDTEALPTAAFSVGQSPYAAPRSRLEARLCRLWGEQLPVGTVGIDDDFFRCGGDSIGGLRLATRLQRETGFKISVRHIFDFPSVRALVGSVLSRAEGPFHLANMEPERAEQEMLRGECPLLPIQKWFFGKPLPNRARWNQNFTIRTPALDTERLRDALGKLVDHHDAFWLRFRQTASGPQQFYANDCPTVVLHTLNVRNLSEPEIQQRLGAWQSVIDLESGPTYCAAYLYGFEDGSARIWFAIHHLIVDVVSWRIITQDLEILYHGGTLGARHSTFREWAQAVQNYKAAVDERRLWARIAQLMAADCSDSALAVQLQATARRERFCLTAPETQGLLTESAWAYGTEVSDLLLTAVGYALQSLTGRSTNYVTVEGHGREPFDQAPDVGDTVGWFTTMHPLQVEVGPDLGRSILLTKANRRRVPYHGLGYGALRGAYGSENAPLAPVTFNYLGRFDSYERGSAATSAAWRLDVPTWASAATSGEAVSDTAVEITMSCVDGQLTTVVDSRLNEEATRRFTAQLETSVRQSIMHTTAVNRTCVSRSVIGAAAVRQQEAFVPYILVNEDAPGRTLFMLPPGEGGAESYLSSIGRKLPGHRLVMFNNLHLYTARESFEVLAQYYIPHVKRIQATGPYNFLGWSFGGVLSLEIANQLARAGGRIDNLILIDSYFNVPKALEEIGLPTVEDLLDPINYRYRPSRADLDRLAERTKTIVLFKAGEPNDVVTSEDQRRLFEHYLRTRCNNLDTLLPGYKVRVEILLSESHHSWVRNQTMVEGMGRLIVRALGAT